MKFTHYMFALLAVAGFSFSSCSDSDDDAVTQVDSVAVDDTAKKLVIENYVSNVILPTYSTLKEESWDLLTAVKKFYASGSQEDLDAACVAWRTMRVPWEQSEAFLFGPADYLKLDPSLDSWPLDQSAIDTYLNSSIDLNYESLQGGLSVNVKGFHTIEYFLFNAGEPAVASEMSARKKHYLLTLTKLLRDNTIQLWAAWNGNNEAVNARDAAVLAGTNSEDWDDAATEEGEAFAWGAYANGYGSYFSTPSLTNAFGFKTYNDALDQIVDGCTDICSEVGEQKIGTPYSTKNVYQVESWYSYNSLTDYEDNIISIENSYLGGLEGSRNSAASLSTFVRARNADLDAQILAQITVARRAIAAIPYPFRNHLDADTEIQNAQAQLATLSDLIDKLKQVWDN